ncbi:polysaccharide pyruvyl transferase family protein [Pseudomonas putida]|uniref:Exopolysaccharide glucosyl ketal-pyruvate-transferase n=1 Tax=Pseudomonas putida TaxID=303 RepID=A0A1Q9R5H6_PSEPU|nr:polysaccharide pyruvyl transferase family protein [Pseudomonas putida]OLS62618.1 Exopolysaccharide glucosyl ketal-pyruvate-transferase [Pseudomonas putida]
MKAVFAAGSDNVGDELNEWIWPALLGDIQRDGVALLGIGTLLNEAFCRRLDSAERILVLGSGAGYGKPPTLDPRWRVHAVRGLRTARALGLDDDRAVADPAYLLASLDWRSARAHGEVVVVPHHRSLRYLDWQRVCAAAGLRFVSPLLPAADFMQAIAGARLVLSEAMHGAILADVARVPWQGFGFGGQFNQDKWLDWAQMFDLNLDIRHLPGFYDPARFSEGRPLRYHLGKVLKVSLSRAGLGREKWQRMTLPSFQVDRAEAALARQLGELARRPGMLSSAARLQLRVTQLYQRVDELRAELQAPPGKRLQGDGLAFLARA